MSLLRLVREPIKRAELAAIGERQFDEMVKAVVDVTRRVLVVGGEMHSDEEALLLDDGSKQQDLWGINLYPAQTGAEWIEFDSMINVRPRLGNRSRGVEDLTLQQTIRTIVEELIP